MGGAKQHRAAGSSTGHTLDEQPELIEFTLAPGEWSTHRSRRVQVQQPPRLCRFGEALDGQPPDVLDIQPAAELGPDLLLEGP